MLINSIYLSCAFLQVDQKMTQNLDIRVILPKLQFGPVRYRLWIYVDQEKAKKKGSNV